MGEIAGRASFGTRYLLRSEHVNLHRGGYNQMWMAEAEKIGDLRTLTEEQVRYIDAVMRERFGLPPR